MIFSCSTSSPCMMDTAISTASSIMEGLYRADWIQMSSFSGIMLKYSCMPPPPVTTLMSVRPASSMACSTPMEVSSSMENTASIWALAASTSEKSLRPASRVNSVA